MGTEKLAEGSSFPKGNLLVIQKLRNFATPFLFVLALFFAFFLSDCISINTKSFFYAISVTIKDVLIFFLPFVIFALVFSSIIKVGVKAMKYIAVIIPLICCSNAISTILTYFCSIGIINIGLVEKIESVRSNITTLEPLFEVTIHNLFPNDIALLSGMICGLLLSFINRKAGTNISKIFDKFTGSFFKLLGPVMPLFVMGTAIKLQHEGVLSVIMTKYISILIAFVISAYSYVVLQCFALSGFNIRKTFEYIKNMLQAVVTAFGSMSSAAALPLSIKAAEKNITNKANAGIIVPSSVNIHLVGDCFFIPMIAISVMISFGMVVPTFSNYLIFVLHFVLAKFAVAAVPGGGLLVMLPVMQKYLGMTPDMLALVTALYILFDPVITACNVMGNGSLAITFDKITSRQKNIIH